MAELIETGSAMIETNNEFMKDPLYRSLHGSLEDHAIGELDMPQADIEDYADALEFVRLGPRRFSEIG